MLHHLGKNSTAYNTMMFRNIAWTIWYQTCAAYPVSNMNILMQNQKVLDFICTLKYMRKEWRDGRPGRTASSKLIQRPSVYNAGNDFWRVSEIFLIFQARSILAFGWSLSVKCRNLRQMKHMHNIYWIPADVHESISKHDFTESASSFYTKTRIFHPPMMLHIVSWTAGMMNQ